MTQTTHKQGAGADRWASLGVVFVGLFFLGSGTLTYYNTRRIDTNAEMVTHTFEVVTTLDAVISYMKDAETGQRGYIITGNDAYLAPYEQARSRVDDMVADLTRLVQDNPEQATRVAGLQKRVDAKLRELASTLRLRRTNGYDAARAAMATDQGKYEMDAIRETVASMRNTELMLRNARIDDMHRSFDLAVYSGAATALIGMLLASMVGGIMSRVAKQRRRQEWLQTGHVRFAQQIAGDPTIEQLGNKVLAFLAEYLDAHAGALYVEDTGVYHRAATYGVGDRESVPERFRSGEGLLGEVVTRGRAALLHNVPAGYLTFGSALAEGTPLHLAIAPATIENRTHVVFELGFIHPVHPLTMELLERLSEPMALAFRSAIYRANLQELLEETQRQSEELQAQGEELRVNNEELEEQSRALRESQTRLEQQQAEMEQTNAQLEEQAQLLEVQRDELEMARNSMANKAMELERASQYKTDFLANMSHELRTPLNSSLILAKLLADNPAGNLTDEQVHFAQTIQSSGNDLLALINDILDLSKIEAGHMDITPEPVSLKRINRDMARVFDAVADQRGLTFKTQLAADCPEIIETDRLRLEQVLRNLIGNAIKFTEEGNVELAITMRSDKRIAFEVRDTGIGIAPDQQSAIFEAFRQADGTISRKYGGTGLGLSISRELVRLLGGEITLKSTPGEGSVFAIVLPEHYDADAIAPAAMPMVELPAATVPQADSAAKPAKKSARKKLLDDREELSGNQRLLLVVEDDASFARVLYDLAHELGFQCLLSDTAEEAVTLARQYMPSAVLLDVGLPDHSGLSVLDRLKHDARTRHIPVHVVSASDHSQTALQLGAVGAMLKPVKREELVQALQQLETKLAQRMRRVLIVEDDSVQRDSMCQLLGSQAVATEAVGSAAECLAKLKSQTFDCMVLDLSLPDTTGFDLLETLSRESDYAFPPVIVYTGRSLSQAEEQKLRKYSKSIIIKGAKSPERLLDEVTLFLHQVVSELPKEQQKMLEKSRSRDELLDGRHVLVVEDDVRNVYALSSILEPHGTVVHIARNGREALAMLEVPREIPIDLVLMDVMMPEMDGITATQEIRKQPQWKKLPIIMLTAKAMRDDQERCLRAGANDYMAKPLDVEKLLSLVRVWMPR